MELPKVFPGALIGGDEAIPQVPPNRYSHRVALLSPGLQERWAKWDWWDANSPSLIIGLILCYDMLMGLQRRWALDPAKAVVLSRLKDVTLAFTSPHTHAMEFAVSRYSYANALCAVKDFVAAEAEVACVLHIAAPILKRNALRGPLVGTPWLPDRAHERLEGAIEGSRALYYAIKNHPVQNQ